MFRHQTHPYQTTVVPRSSGQFEHSNRQRAKYPWLENPHLQQQHQQQQRHHHHQLDSSNDDASSCYQQPGHYTLPRGGSQWATRSHSDGMSSPTYHVPYLEGGGGGACPPSTALNEYSKPTYALPLATHESESSGPTGIAAVPMAHSPIPSEMRAPGGCGGHCPGFEYVCYYVLQIIFVVGILTGISLCIAGSVLRRSNRGGDLGVLVYIGCLSFMVCSLLLGIQCCVKRSNKQRCKQIRMMAGRQDCIPLESIPNPYIGDQMAAAANMTHQATRQMQPLLYPAAPASIVSTLPRSYYRNEHQHNRDSSAEEINGIPWWRR